MAWKERGCEELGHGRRGTVKKGRRGVVKSYGKEGEGL